MFSSKENINFPPSTGFSYWETLQVYYHLSLSPDYPTAPGIQIRAMLLQSTHSLSQKKESAASPKGITAAFAHVHPLLGDQGHCRPLHGLKYKPICPRTLSPPPWSTASPAAPKLQGHRVSETSTERLSLVLFSSHYSIWSTRQCLPF